MTWCPSRLACEESGCRDASAYTQPTPVVRLSDIEDLKLKLLAAESEARWLRKGLREISSLCDHCEPGDEFAACVKSSAEDTLKEAS